MKIVKNLSIATLVVILAGSISGCWLDAQDCPDGYYWSYNIGHCRANDQSHYI